MVEQDVSLVSFQAAKAVWEKEIEAGRLREVCHVELGYCAYLDAAQSDVVRLMPIWACYGSHGAVPRTSRSSKRMGSLLPTPT